MKPWLPPFCFGLSLGVSGTAFWLAGRPGGEQPDLGHYAAVRDFVEQAFVRDVSRAELSRAAMHGLASSLDEYSRYYDERESGQLERETEGRYRGIGAVFRAPVERGQVLFALPGTPAERAGLRPGDRILRVDDQPIEGLGEARLRELLARAHPESIRLDLVALDGAERQVELRKGSIVDPSVRRAELLDAALGIGYLALGSFSQESPEEVDSAIEALRGRGLRSLVIDLRGNPGGVLLAAVEIARRFVAEGLIVSTEGRERCSEHRADVAKAWLRGLPLVLLVDERSASASEVLAGALQEHRAAVLVGQRSFGKGMVQTIRRFPELGTVAKVTSSYYFTPAHRCLDRSLAPESGGIEPDFVVEVSAAEKLALHPYLGRYSPPDGVQDELRAWEEREGLRLLEPRPSDAQLDAALRLLRGEPPAPGKRS